MALNPNQYPVDYTGTQTSNLISNELVTLTPRAKRIFVPRQAPYFKKNIVIVDTATNTALTTAQYLCYSQNATASAIAGIGSDVYHLVVITDQSVSNNLSVTYQTVGGDYISDFSVAAQMLASLTQDTRPVTWDNTENRPTTFASNLHLQPISEATTWEYLLAALEQLALVVLLGDDLKKDFILSYIDNALANSNAATSVAVSSSSAFGAHVNNTQNPHQVTAAQLNLGNVQNFAIATLAEVYAGVVTNKYVTVDQVAAAVRNAVNLGMDAHILNLQNPHQVTAALIGLGLVQNYGLATLTDLNVPASGNPLYVTNGVLAQWLAAYFSAQQTSLASSLSTLTASVAAAQSTAASALTAATAAKTAADAATAAATNAQASATNALTQAQTNAQNITSSNTAAQTLVQQYAAAAVAAADAAGFTRGYAAGVAATHS